jgi:ElaB/YqjD/DUF883 family membrane-anchored ribosome-binding protein
MEEQRPGEGGPANKPPFPTSGGEIHRPVNPEASAFGEASASPSGTPEDEIESALGSARESLDRARQESDAFGEQLGAAASSMRSDARRLATDTGERIRRRAEERIHSGFRGVADRLDDAAERIDRVASDRLDGPGAQGRVGDAAHSTASLIEEAAEYLRETDLRGMQADLERRVRERPLQTILLAAGAGWLVGKIMK